MAASRAVAPHHHVHHTGQRQQHTRHLTRRQPVAQKSRRAHGNQHRRGGVDQGDVHGGRGLRAQVDPGATDQHAQSAQHQVLPGRCPQMLPLLP
jgi:hypothetical protein